MQSFSKKKKFFNNSYVLETDPSQDEFSLSDVGSSFASAQSEESTRQLLLEVPKAPPKKSKEPVDLRSCLWGTTHRKLAVMWFTVLICLMLLVFAGFASDKFLADEACYVLITFIGKHS